MNSLPHSFKTNTEVSQSELDEVAALLAQLNLTSSPNRSGRRCRSPKQTNFYPTHEIKFRTGMKRKGSEVKQVPTLDHLPEEILVYIFAEVPFSPKAIMDLALVCRLFCRMIALGYKTESNVISRQIAKSQFNPIHLIQNYTPNWHNINRLRMIHDGICGIVKMVKENMSDEDFQNESDNWEDQLFISLSLCATRCQKISRLKSYWTFSLPKNVQTSVILAIRYACIKVAQCFSTIISRSPVPNPTFATIRPTSEQIDEIADSLERLMLEGHYNEEHITFRLLDLLEDVRMDQNRHPGSMLTILARGNYRVRYRRAFSSFPASFMSPGPNWLLSDIGAESLLIDDPSNNVELDVPRQTAKHTLILINRLVGDEKISILAFMRKHRLIAARDEEMREFLEDGMDSPTTILHLSRLNRVAVFGFAWEAVVRTDLLRGDSELRQSFRPSISFLKQVGRHNIV